jgi:hypothetical protein
MGTLLGSSNVEKTYYKHGDSNVICCVRILKFLSFLQARVDHPPTLLEQSKVTIIIILMVLENNVIGN